MYSPPSIAGQGVDPQDGRTPRRAARRQSDLRQRLRDDASPIVETLPVVTVALVAAALGLVIVLVARRPRVDLPASRSASGPLSAATNGSSGL
jgi:hypothetical protein